MTAAIAKPSGELVELEVADIPFVPPEGSWEELREVTRCTGHCCRSFTLVDSPVELGAKVIRSRRHRAGDVVGGEPLRPETADWIATALVYLGVHDVSPSGLNNITQPPAPPGHVYEPSKGSAHWYTCRHLDDDSCGIYDTRPDVCSDYPYKGNQCHNPSCTRRTTMAAGLSWWRAGEPAEELVKAVEVDG